MGFVENCFIGVRTGVNINKFVKESKNVIDTSSSHW